MEHPVGIFSGPLLVLVRGILSKSWNIRWCILYPGNGQSPSRLEIFDSETHSVKHPKDKKVIPLENIESIHEEKLQNKPKGFEYGFEIVTKNQKYSFGVDSETSLNNWITVLEQVSEEGNMANQCGTNSNEDEDLKNLYMDDNIIYESADSNSVPMFRVQINDNETAKRFNLHGWYFLAINPINLALIHPGTRKALYQWPYRFIRRFGKTDTIFQFESGRRCISGAGSFIFHTTEGEAIYEKVNIRTKQIRHQEEAVPLVIPEDSLNVVLPESPQNQNQESRSRVLSIDNVQKPIPKPRNPDKTESFLRSNSVGQPVTLGYSSMKEISRVLSNEHNNNHNTIGPSHLKDSFKKELDMKLKQQETEETEKPETVVENKEDNNKPAEQKSQSAGTLSDKKKKQEEKKRREEEEKEKKKRLKEEQKRKKEEQKRLKEEEKRNKQSQKKKHKNISEALISAPVMNTYEDICDVTTADEVECAYSEPISAAVTSSNEEKNAARSSTKSLKPEENNMGDIYSKPVKKKGEAWKEHCPEGDNEHKEDYDKIKIASSLNVPTISQPVKDEELDDTYDTFASSKKSADIEHIYGEASAISVSKVNTPSTKQSVPLYEEPDPLHSNQTQEEPLYDEANVEIMAAEKSKEITQEEQDEEDPYSDVR